MKVLLMLLYVIARSGACEPSNDCCKSNGLCIDPVFDDCSFNGSPGRLDYGVDCYPSYFTCCLPQGPLPTDTTTRVAEMSPVVTETNNLSTTSPQLTTPEGVIEVPQDGCGLSSSERVVGGTGAAPHSWPWQVSLKIDYDWIAQEHYCGGTLVSNEWVVTAAHCLKTMGADDLKVILAAHNKPGFDVGDEVERSIALTIVHPGYTRNAGSPDDIALIKLSEPVQFGSKIQPACLPNTNLPQFTAETNPECWITGWGDTKGTGDNNVLNELQVTVVPQEYCRSQWSANPNVQIGDGQICINNGLTGACNGDSGGPLVCRNNGRWVLAGATSFGVKGCQTEGAPDVYTRVSFYLPWLLQEMSAN